MRLRMYWLDNRMRACQCNDRGNRKMIHMLEAVVEYIWVSDLVNLMKRHREDCTWFLMTLVLGSIMTSE